ncbi:MAG: DUF4845 domain-containing protein [Pseudomonadales bacterium]
MTTQHANQYHASLAASSRCVPTPARQLGLGMLGMLVVILFGGFLITCAVKMLPYYVDNWNVQSILKDVQEQFSGNPMVKKEEIVDKLSKRLYIDMVDSIAMSDIVVKKEMGAYLITANYEKRINLMGNVDVVIMFNNNTAEIPLTSR